MLICVCHTAGAQFYGIKTNTLALATGTVNAGFEISVSRNISLDMSVYFNPIKSEQIQMQAFVLQPAVRYWMYQSFAGHFLSAHLAYANYKIGNSDKYNEG